MRLAHLIDYYAFVTKYFKIVFLPIQNRCHHKPSSDYQYMLLYIFKKKKVRSFHCSHFKSALVITTAYLTKGIRPYLEHTKFSHSWN